MAALCDSTGPADVHPITQQATAGMMMPAHHSPPIISSTVALLVCHTSVIDRGRFVRVTLAFSSRMCSHRTGPGLVGALQVMALWTTWTHHGTPVALYLRLWCARYGLPNCRLFI